MSETKELLEGLDAALEAGRLVRGPALEVKGKKIVLEWTPLPVVGLSREILYRFRSPIETVWVTHQQSLASTLVETMERFAYRTWRDMVLQGKHVTEIDSRIREQFLEGLEGPEVYECEIVRKK